MGTSSSFASERDSVNRKSPGEEEKGGSLIAPLSPRRRRRRRKEGDGDGSFHLLLLKLAPKVGQRTLPTYLHTVGAVSISLRSRSCTGKKITTKFLKVRKRKKVCWENEIYLTIYQAPFFGFSLYLGLQIVFAPSATVSLLLLPEHTHDDPG